MTHYISILRNPYGFTEEQVRQARNTAADRIEELERKVADHLVFSNYAHHAYLNLNRPCPVPTNAQIEEYLAACSEGLGSPDPDLIEAVAKAIYRQWHQLPGYVEWVDAGNSHRQDTARRLARVAIESAS